MKKKILFLIFLISSFKAPSQKLNFLDPSPSYDKQRATGLAIGLGSTYVVSMVGLYQLWYAENGLGKFHFFNDNAEWLQMDKVGHLGTAYIVGDIGNSMFSWAGISRKKSIWLGGMMGWVFQTSVEVFDGFSPEWGFSWGDFAANTAGSAIFISQALVWDEQRIRIKFSYHQTEYADMRPDLLGSSFAESLFKDYNGQTYWLSLNLHSLLFPHSSVPPWLNVAFGYGADGMLGGRTNPENYEGQDFSGIERIRQFYFSPDIDLSKIKSKNRFIKTLCASFGFIKIPLPTIEYNSSPQFKFHYFYF